MTDVLMYSTLDGGDIFVDDGTIRMGDGLETAAYLSLFGSDSEYWGDVGEIPERQYPAKTGKMLNTLPLTSANLARIEKAAEQDLKFFIDMRIANTVTVSASIVSPTRVQLYVTIHAEGEDKNFTFTENWKATT